MNAALGILANSEDELNPVTVEWRNQVMDMAFQIEDSVDDYMHKVDDDANTVDVGFVQRIVSYVNGLRDRRNFAKEIKELKNQLTQVFERRKRYKTEGASSSRHVAVDPRMTASYLELVKLFGMDGPKNDIVNLLEEVGDASLQCLRVVSIVGSGGLGKTTLASKVYCELGGQYHCKAFVSVSQRPDMMELLLRIRSQLWMAPVPHATEVDSLISIREYLSEKRYLIVIDDIWDASAWETIRSAFPDNQNGSKVITTTRIELVAKACCSYQHEFIYRMRPLDDQSSKTLFFNELDKLFPNR